MSTCDEAGSGTCTCDTGWAGAACDMCAPGYYGPTCVPMQVWDNAGAPIATFDSLTNDAAPSAVTPVITAGPRALIATVVAVSTFNDGSHGVSSIDGCDLTWTPVRKRYDGMATFAEIWWAQAPSALSSCTVTVSYAGTSDNKHVAIYAVAGAGGIGASADAPLQSGTKLAIQMPALHSAGSSVLAIFGVGDSSNSLTPRPGQSQTSFASGSVSSYHVVGPSLGVGTAPLVGYEETMITSWAGVAVELTPEMQTVSGIVFDGGAPIAQVNRDASSSADLDTGAFSTSGPDRLILVIAMTGRTTQTPIGFASMTVDPTGNAIALSKHSTSFNDTWAAVELWYGVAPSQLTNVIVRGSVAVAHESATLLVVALSGYNSTYLGAADSEFTSRGYLSKTLAATKPGSLSLFAGYAESPNSASVSPFPGNIELYDKEGFYEHFADFTLGSWGGLVTVGGADGANHQTKGAAWEILSQ